ncbi:hypothetical protein H257_09272 [Aphanomyces astaci]|uniref:Phosphatidate cytidylyltransferase, mitochondrial n=1 Tax=Aphanomyces astaci TaxID=112090 RepID=W4GAX7_APHAT|nr:hypothetical protein H257_09272 [Aphanomyces astaci]ETV76825.1 hypothetical protein H257_09272 [Aphanomyces astaci]|eukprot:XP_009833737.1 hypothetical protein H257_09272 [Aphanomyces astaci]
MNCLNKYTSIGLAKAVLHTNMAASLSALLPYFPPVDFAMGYGSAVFQQSGHNDSTSMIDLVLAVEDPLAWHTEQLQRHPEHYSGIKHLGPEAIVYVQENFGAGCYYNTLVPVPGSSQLMKYGVVKTSTLCHELTEWSTLYLSGRMHKPVNIITSTPAIDAAASTNLTNALHLAILGLPETFTEEQLFMKIAGISYWGDFRMVFGENPKKVRNIVHGSLDKFKQLYQPQIDTSPFVCRLHGSNLQSDMSPEARNAMLLGLPHNITCRLSEKSRLKVTQTPHGKKLLKFAVSAVVGQYSRTQSLKGIATAGGIKTLVYVWQKLSRTYLGK